MAWQVLSKNNPRGLRVNEHTPKCYKQLEQTNYSSILMNFYPVYIFQR